MRSHRRVSGGGFRVKACGARRSRALTPESKSKRAEGRMRKTGVLLLAGCGLLIALGGMAAAQVAPAGATGAAVAAPEPAFGDAATLYPGTREYVWTFYVAVLTTEPVDVVTRVLVPGVRS